MAGANKGDIHIGENQSIYWVEFAAESNDFADVDYTIAKYPDFWASLEINCVSGCCGLDAFRFYPSDIADASTYIDKEALKEDLIKLKLDLVKSNKSIINSRTLNNLVDKSVFIELLDHVVKCL